MYFVRSIVIFTLLRCRRALRNIVFYWTAVYWHPSIWYNIFADYYLQHTVSYDGKTHLSRVQCTSISYHFNMALSVRLSATSRVRKPLKADILSGWLRKYHLGLYSLSRRTSYRNILLSLETARVGFIRFQSLSNLTGSSAAVPPRPIKYQSDAIIITSNFVAARLHVARTFTSVYVQCPPIIYHSKKMTYSFRIHRHLGLMFIDRDKLNHHWLKVSDEIDKYKQTTGYNYSLSFFS